MRTVGICIDSKHNTNIDAVVALILWQNIQFFLASKMELKQTKPLCWDSTGGDKNQKNFWRWVWKLLCVQTWQSVPLHSPRPLVRSHTKQTCPLRNTAGGGTCLVPWNNGPPSSLEDSGAVSPGRGMLLRFRVLGLVWGLVWLFGFFGGGSWFCFPFVFLTTQLPFLEESFSKIFSRTWQKVTGV